MTSRRLTATLAVLAAIAAAAVTQAASGAQQAAHAKVHSFVARDGATVVLGYDGGAPLAP